MSEPTTPIGQDVDEEKAAEHPGDVDYTPAGDPDAEEYVPEPRFESTYDDAEVPADDEALDPDEEV